MSHRFRRMSLFVLGMCLAGPALVQAAPEGLAREREEHIRVYDRDHRDYHVWNTREERKYRSYLAAEHRSYRRYWSLRRAEQREYWNWRHARHERLEHQRRR